MRRSTLCYITRGREVLMLHRVKKADDANEGKWIGVGGGIEAHETPEQCLLREVREETGLTLIDHRARGIVHFRSDLWEDEEMYLFTSDRFTGELSECDEGDLEWMPMDSIPDLELWEGDRIFLNLLADDAPYFDLTLIYRGSRLIRALLDGAPLPVND